MFILRFYQTPGISGRILGHSAAITFLLFWMMLSATAAGLPGGGTPQISLLKEFRPIGGTGNNLKNPELDVVPGTPEIALTPLNFVRGTRDELVDGPNPRTISNVIDYDYAFVST